MREEIEGGDKDINTKVGEMRILERHPSLPVAVAILAQIWFLICQHL